MRWMRCESSGSASRLASGAPYNVMPMRAGAGDSSDLGFSGWAPSFNKIIERQTGHESETFVLYCGLQGMLRMPFGFFFRLFSGGERGGVHHAL